MKKTEKKFKYMPEHAAYSTREEFIERLLFMLAPRMTNLEEDKRNKVFFAIIIYIDGDIEGATFYKNIDSNPIPMVLLNYRKPVLQVFIIQNAKNYPLPRDLYEQKLAESIASNVWEYIKPKLTPKRGGTPPMSIQ